MVFEGLDDLVAGVGRELGGTDWVTVTQERVDAFAASTGATPATPAGIVSPYLILSMSNFLLPQMLQVRNVSMGVNYGTGQVRFPAPVPVGSRVRGCARLAAADPVRGGIQTTVVIIIEIEGGDQPAAVIDSLSRWLA